MAQVLVDIATGTADNATSSAILVPLIQQLSQQIDDAIHLDGNRKLLEDSHITVDWLVRMWIAEGLVNTNEDAEYDYELKSGHSYVKFLENRCLFQVEEEDHISVHDVCQRKRRIVYWRQVKVFNISPT